MTNDRFRYVFFTSCISFPFSLRIHLFFLFRSFIKLFFCIVFSFRLSIGVCVCRYLFRLELLSFRFVSKLALINDFCALYLWFERGFFPAILKELTNNRGGIGITVGSIRVQSIYFFAAFLLSPSLSPTRHYGMSFAFSQASFVHRCCSCIWSGVFLCIVSNYYLYQTLYGNQSRMNRMSFKNPRDRKIYGNQSIRN